MSRQEKHLERITINHNVSYKEVKKIWEKYGNKIGSLHKLDHLFAGTNDRGFSLLEFLETIDRPLDFSMNKTKEITVKRAKEIAEDLNYEQVVIMGFHSVDSPHYHVTTYGTDKEKCKQAAKAGDFVKDAIGGNWG